MLGGKRKKKRTKKDEVPGFKDRAIMAFGYKEKLKEMALEGKLSPPKGKVELRVDGKRKEKEETGGTSEEQAEEQDKEQAEEQDREQEEEVQTPTCPGCGRELEAGRDVCQWCTHEPEQEDG